MNFGSFSKQFGTGSKVLTPIIMEAHFWLCSTTSTEMTFEDRLMGSEGWLMRNEESTQVPSWMDVWAGRECNRRSGKAKWGRFLCNHLEQGHWRGEHFPIPVSKSYHLHTSPHSKISNPIQAWCYIHLRWWIDPDNDVLPVSGFCKHPHPWG